MNVAPDPLRGFVSVCLTLDERPDRTDAFQKQRHKSAFLMKVPFHFYRGRTVRSTFVPPSWPLAAGHYCAGQDHRQIMEWAWMNSDLEVLLVFEDDATILPGFDDAFDTFLNKVPDTAIGLLLGGRHRGTPEAVGDVVRLRDTLGMHAYMLGRVGIVRVLDHLYCRPHAACDQAFAELQGIDPRFFAPREWIVGEQNLGSDTNR